MRPVFLKVRLKKMVEPGANLLSRFEFEVDHIIDTLRESSPRSAHTHMVGEEYCGVQDAVLDDVFSYI